MGEALAAADKAMSALEDAAYDGFTMIGEVPWSETLLLLDNGDCERTLSPPPRGQVDVRMVAGEAYARVDDEVRQEQPEFIERFIGIDGEAGTETL